MVTKSQSKLAFYPELQYSQLYSETQQATLHRMPAGAEIYATVCDDRFFFFFLAMLHSMWDLSFSTKD